MEIKGLQELIEEKASKKLMKDIRDFISYCNELDIYQDLKECSGHEITRLKNDNVYRETSSFRVFFCAGYEKSQIRIKPGLLNLASMMYATSLPKRIEQETKGFMERFEKSQEVFEE